MKKKTRRNFIRLLNAGAVFLLLFLWNKLTQNHINQENKKEKSLPFNPNKTVSFFENYIVVNQDEKLTVFSSRCTHLGCKIQEIQNGRLVCPCHGSQYNLNGNPVKGPAYKKLKIVDAQVSADSKTIEIKS